MQPDLEDALIPVKWAEAQIPILQERFIAWQRERPHEFVMEEDPDDAGWEFLVARLTKPLDPKIIGDIGAIINSTRSALDILIAKVGARHGVKPSGKTHFPIRRLRSEFLGTVNGIEAKYRLSAAETTAIKNAKAYEGGHKFLFPLHTLDILRKHERTLIIEPELDSSTYITMLGASVYTHHVRLEDKTILHRIPKGRFRPTKGNILPSAAIFFNEPALLVTKQPAILVLKNFVWSVDAFIRAFP